MHRIEKQELRIAPGQPPPQRLRDGSARAPRLEAGVCLEHQDDAGEDSSNCSLSTTLGPVAGSFR